MCHNELTIATRNSLHLKPWQGENMNSIRGLLINNEVFIWNCVSRNSPSPLILFLFRVSPEIYEHPVHHRGFDPRREDQSVDEVDEGDGDVRHISIPRREQQRLFPVRSYIMYPPLTGRPAQSYCRRPTNGLESTGNDTWFMVLLHTRATALERNFLERTSLARLQVHRGCARACTAKCVADYPLCFDGSKN